MAIPTTNIALANNIYGEANGGYPGSVVVSLNDISFYSYFAGPNGSNSISYNAYGKGENSGLNRIYGTNAVGNPDDMDDFKGVTYFYDNSTYQVTLDVVNNLVSTPPPPFPVDNEIDVTVELYDDSITYMYLQANTGIVNAPGSTGALQASATNDPIIFRGYWKVIINGLSPTFAGGTCDISINGNAKVTGGAVAAGPGGTTFTSTGSGTEDVATYLGLTGLYFAVTVN
jgi:hypothetical protein